MEVSAFASFVDCSHKVSQTPVVSDVFVVPLLYFLSFFWGSHVQEHLDTIVRREATVFHGGTVDGRIPAPPGTYIYIYIHIYKTL